MIGKTFEKKIVYRNNAMWQVGKRNKDLSRKAPYVSERTYMFQKNPICLKKRPICCPYVVLSEGFSSPYVEKAPYVANQVPMCGPYAAHMWPICFGCSSAK